MQPRPGFLTIPSIFVLATILALAAPDRNAWPAATKITPGVPVPAPRAPQSLRAFGTVLWHRSVVMGPHQDACVGDQFYGPGVSVDFGIVMGRYRDRVYFRTDRKIVREWEIPAPGQPDSSIAWANRFVRQFASHDTLFAELHDTGEPVFATGSKGVRMKNLFRKWVSETFGPDDYKEAAELGVPVERLTGPPPERICPLGVGGG